MRPQWLAGPQGFLCKPVEANDPAIWRQHSDTDGDAIKYCAQHGIGMVPEGQYLAKRKGTRDVSPQFLYDRGVSRREWFCSKGPMNRYDYRIIACALHTTHRKSQTIRQ